MGGGESPLGEQSTTAFVNAEGSEVATYTDAEAIFVKVTDTSQSGISILAGALEIEGIAVDLVPIGIGGEFMTDVLELDVAAGQTLTATYTDPTNPLDTSTDTVAIVSSVLAIDSFVIRPNPFEVDVTFSYIGTGIAQVMTVAIYDLSGQLVQELQASDATEIAWDGTKGMRCFPVANGAYIYVVVASDATNSFSHKGIVFLNRR
jgi:hypothetical protein